jgi:ATP-dependent Clp protease adaptor protein ClpS
LRLGLRFIYSFFSINILQTIKMATEILPETPGVMHEGDERVQIKLLPLYRIIMWDDDVTTMEFVIRMLVKVIGVEYSEAEKLMFQVHFTGFAHVATMPLERAEFKVQQVHTAAALEDYPFRCTIEPE